MSTHETATRYPLSWPDNWTRTKAYVRKRASFSRDSRALTVADALRRISGELGRLGAVSELLSTNLDVRLDGLPRSGQAEPQDPGAAVWFWLKKKPMCLACDRWDRVADNIAAIAQHIDALRRIDRYGVGSVEQAFAGYVCLPPTAEDWAIVLMVQKDATRDQIIAAYRQLALIHHPDKGGRHEDMARLTAARDRALERFP